MYPYFQEILMIFGSQCLFCVEPSIDITKHLNYIIGVAFINHIHAVNSYLILVDEYAHHALYDSNKNEPHYSFGLMITNTHSSRYKLHVV